MAENSGDLSLGYMMGQSEGNNSGMFGGGSDGLWAFLLFALIFGGNNGFGFGGGHGNCATQADVRAAVDQQTLISKLDNQTYGLADSTYALNNTITNGFHGVDNAICNLGYNMQSGFNTLGYNMKDCCCDLGRQIERGFCDTNANIAAQTRSIMDYLTNEKIESLRSERDNLRLKVSQADQNATLRAAIDASTAEIIRRTGNDCPVPSYLVQPPTPVNFPINGCGTVQFGNYGGNCCCG